MKRTWALAVAAATVTALLGGCSPSSKTGAAASTTASQPSSGSSDSSSASSSQSPSSSAAVSSAAPAPGGDIAGLSGPDVLKRVAAALQAAGSARATGTAAFLGTSPGKFVMVLNRDAAEVTLSYQGASVELISIKTASYMKAPLALWTAEKLPSATAKKLAGKWIALPNSMNTGANSFTLDGLAKELEHPTDSKVLAKTEKSTFHGVPVIVVKQADGSVLYVSAAGPALPLYLKNGSKDKAEITFSDFGKGNTITAPKGALDLSQLAGTIKS
ncbi:MAG: hypothetical protein QOI42_1267 [Frankiaceae bacterium]|nr:hypothetical protein [Frankiaceae bacterium]